MYVERVRLYRSLDNTAICVCVCVYVILDDVEFESLGSPWNFMTSLQRSMEAGSLQKCQVTERC